MTDEAKALVKQLLLAKRSYVVGGHTKHEWVNPDGPVAADLIETQARELAKWKALAETLAGALEDIATDGLHTPSKNVSLARGTLTSYKEQRDD